MTTTCETLASLARRAYYDLVNDADPEVIYGALKTSFAEHGLDADTAESAVDWVEGGTLVEDLTDALERAGVSDHDDIDLPEPECDCGDFADCRDCRAWAEQQIAQGLSPWDIGKDLSEDDDPLPPKNFVD